MEQLFSKDTTLWDRFSSILDNYPEISVKKFTDCETETVFYEKFDPLLSCYRKVAVSLSGGVDSMLLSYYLSICEKK